jgi:hypothetical protein
MRSTTIHPQVRPQPRWRLPSGSPGGRITPGLFAIAPLWVLLWTLPSVGAPADLDQRLKEERQELKQLKGQIQDYKDRLERTKRRERTVVQDLDESDRLLQQKRRELQTHEQNLKLQADKHAALVKEMEDLTGGCRPGRGSYILACVRSTSRVALPISPFCCRPRI